MLNQIATFFENVSKALGLSVKIPRPSQTVRKVCSVTNGIFGVVLIGTGSILKKPLIIVLGALGIVSAALLALDQ